MKILPTVFCLSTTLIAFTTATPLRVGQAVKCQNDVNLLNIYRYLPNEIRLYPNPAVASSWDDNWMHPVILDCRPLIAGPPMTMAPKEGHSVRCEGSDNKVYRFSKHEIRWYTSEEIADSWDADWRNFLTIDCRGLKQGKEFTSIKVSPMMDQIVLTNLKDGQAVKCQSDSHPFNVYRYLENAIHLYPTASIAESWDPKWMQYIVIDCRGVTGGDDMVMAPKNRQVIKCEDDINPDKVYRYSPGEIYWFKNRKTATSWFAFWDHFKTIDCRGLVESTQNPKGVWFQGIRSYLKERWNAPGLGKMVKCLNDTDSEKRYRFLSNEIRLYPNSKIAASWGSKWVRKTKAIYCGGLKEGLPMTMAPKEGHAVKCEGETDKVYRFSKHQIRLYSTPQIAHSWDHQWRHFVTIDCRGIRDGAPFMVAKGSWRQAQ